MSKLILSSKKLLSDRKVRKLYADNSGFLSCLLPLLTALNWKGDERELVEATPYLSSHLDLAGFIAVMDNLNYSVNKSNLKLFELDERLLPCLFVDKTNKPKLILAKKQKKITVYDPDKNSSELIEIDDTKGTAYWFKPNTVDSSAERSKSWFRDLIDHYRPLVLQVLLLTLVQSLLLLAVPIFVMNVYDKVITAGSYRMLIGFSIGVLLSLGLMAILQQIRGQVLAYVGAQLDQRIGISILKKVLLLPPMATEKSSVNSQLSQIKNFDNVRDFFSGQTMISFLDFPFLIIFIIALGIIGKWLVLVPIIMLLLLMCVIWFLRQFVFYRLRRAASESSTLQTVTIEILSNLRLLKLLNATKAWLKRYKKLIADKAFANYQSALMLQVINAIADAVMILGGLAILSFGAISVLKGTITVGALLASMILTWRILMPIKSMFLTLVQIEQVQQGIKQINNLMSIEDESEGYVAVDERPTNGNIQFKNVSLRFPKTTEPTLAGISLTVKAGELIGITGRMGAGKSTLLKSILNFYQLSSGEIYIDDNNITQYLPSQLRQSISFVPQKNQFFYGTIRQNLLLNNPLASDKRIEKVLIKVGVWQQVKNLTKGLETRIRDQQQVFSQSFLQRLNIARALLNKSKILLLDEVTDNFDDQADRDFQKMLDNIRGKMTVIMITQRPSHLKLCEKIIVMNDGRVEVMAEPEAILDKLLTAYKNGKA